MESPKISINNSTDKKELLKIIRSLIAFIVVDGKASITEDGSKEDYIKKYLYTLSKTMNSENQYVNMILLCKIIEKDIESLNLTVTD